MNLTEKLTYIKGLCEGLELAADTKEAKVLLAVVDLLDDLSAAVSADEAEIRQIYDELDAIDDDLTDIEEALADDECDCEDGDCGCGKHNCHHHDDDEDACDEENPLYEVTCPKCGEVVCMDEETLLGPNCVCPNCGTPFEIEFDEEDADKEDEDK